MSISTLRRKIKSNAVEYRMEEGRYLIRFEDASDVAFGYASSDSPPTPPAVKSREVVRAALPTLPPSNDAAIKQELAKVMEELQKSKDSGSLQWRALEARVTGLAKKLEAFTEQMAELKMLVRIFEEKLDGRL